MPKDLTNPFDPKRFAKQIAFDDMMRGLLIAGVALAILLTLLLPSMVLISGLIAPAVVLGLWLWMSVSTARVARSLATFGELIASEPKQAEEALGDMLSVKPVMRWARLLSYHRLAGLRHLQRRFAETSAICLCLLSQPLKGPAAATRPHLLLMLAEAQLEIGNLPGAYHALAHLQQTKLGLAQSLLHRPRFLVVDEPTAGLDPEERIRFRNIITDVGDQLGPREGAITDPYLAAGT